jgi:hypothetical protein
LAAILFRDHIFSGAQQKHDRDGTHAARKRYARNPDFAICGLRDAGGNSCSRR